MKSVNSPLLIPLAMPQPTLVVVCQTTCVKCTQFLPGAQVFVARS